MSGGVDSAVAAARAVDAGHDVVGVHLRVVDGPGHCAPGHAAGCSRGRTPTTPGAPPDVLGIPFYVWDFADRFKGRRDRRGSSMPNAEARPPIRACAATEDQVRGARDKAIALGFDALQPVTTPRLSGGELRRAVDDDKDQSYVLAVLDRTAEPAMFPRGETPSSRSG